MCIELWVKMGFVHIPLKILFRCKNNIQNAVSRLFVDKQEVSWRQLSKELADACGMFITWYSIGHEAERI